MYVNKKKRLGVAVKCKEKIVFSMTILILETVFKGAIPSKIF